MDQRERTFGLLVIGILFGPPALMSVYLWLSRWPYRWFTPGSDWVALLLSVGMGLICIGRLPLPDRGRAALALLYVPVAGFALVIYTLYFVGLVFGDWM